MMELFKRLTVLLPILFLLSCESNNELGIRDSRAEFMVELQGALKENNIPYKMDDEGYIRYSEEYKEVVENIKNSVDKNIASEVGTKFDNSDSTEYLRKLLEEYGIKYRVESRDDGEWTFWRPKSDSQQKEIEMKVVTQSFETQKQ